MLPPALGRGDIFTDGLGESVLRSVVRSTEGGRDDGGVDGRPVLGAVPRAPALEPDGAGDSVRGACDGRGAACDDLFDDGAGFTTGCEGLLDGCDTRGGDCAGRDGPACEGPGEVACDGRGDDACEGRGDEACDGRGDEGAACGREDCAGEFPRLADGPPPPRFAAAVLPPLLSDRSANDETDVNASMQHNAAVMMPRDLETTVNVMFMICLRSQSTGTKCVGRAAQPHCERTSAYIMKR